MKKSIAATAIAASTLGGVAAGAAWFTPMIAGAQDDPSATAPEVDHLREALQDLVDDGTISEEQRDAVVAALREQRPDRDGIRDRARPGAEAVAEILGLDSSTIRAALRDGQSLADIAAEQGVDSDELVDALVDAAEVRVEAALEAGRIDDEKAAAILADAEEHAEAVVNGDVRPGRPGHRLGPEYGNDPAA